MEPTSKTLGGMVRALPYTAPQAALMAALLTRDPKWAVVAGAMALNDGLNGVFRTIAGAIAERRDWDGTGAPSAAVGEKCAMIPGVDYGGPSMPSRYAQLLAFAAAYAVAHVADREHRTEVMAAIVGSIVVATVLAVASRGFSQCNTGPQVTVGTLLGAAFGVVAYYAINIWPEKKLPRPEDDERYRSRPV
jgi:hypothetical protein